jgi:sRNA-binding carbon storage regulator CsrA
MSRNRRSLRPLKRGLVIDRKFGEAVSIPLPSGEEIIVTQLARQRGKFHIHAPETLKILRRELEDRPAA